MAGADLLTDKTIKAALKAAEVIGKAARVRHQTAICAIFGSRLQRNQ